MTSQEQEEDWQQQIDEIVALSSIFEDDFRLAGVQGLDDADALDEPPEPESLYTVKAPSTSPWGLELDIAVHCTLPCSPYNIKLSTAGYTIQHLPPIMCSVTLSPGYPSIEQPQHVALSSLWLSQQQVARLVEQLHALYKEQGGPILYTWIDWLQQEALQFLGLDQGICLENLLMLLHEEDEDEEEDNKKRNLVLNQSPEQLLMSLMRYNASRDHQLFQKSVQTCNICFEEQPGTQFIRLDCGHYYCSTCLTGLSQVCLADGSLDAIRCPEPKCSRPLEPHVLKLLLTEEEFNRWDDLVLKKALDTMADACYCPRCNSLALEDADDNHAACPKCFYDFCSLCNEARHPGLKCVSNETKLEMLRRKAEGGGAAAVEELRRKEQDLLSMAVIEKNAKPCPRCGIAIERSAGCNKMTCTNCAAYFCFKCGAEIRGYDHYKEGSSCILFDEAEILRWERQWEEEVERHQAAMIRNEYFGQLAEEAYQRQQELDGEAGQQPRRRMNDQAANCPQCGQLNHKIARNNHIQCWSCTRYFCASCRTVLQGRGGNHYRPGGCKQHS